ncbi:MAG: hypothetical protein P4N59_11085 [Negativicutes bacterium]|nr:hypothetical protein [Negativicutes bacterium]
MRVETEVQRTECIIDCPKGYDCAFVRIDYLTGLTLLAREWVSINGQGEVGLKGKAWWRERFGITPDNEEHALKLASALRPPKRLVMEYRANSVAFVEYIYQITTESDATIGGQSSLFLPDQDRIALDLALCEPAISSRWSKYEATPNWWDQTKLNTTGHRYRRLADPFRRSSITPDDKDFVERVLEASREFSKGRPHLNGTQAAKNLSMAYTLAVPAQPEELRPFFSLILSINDFVLTDHHSALLNKLALKLDESWLEKLIEPRLNAINSYSEDDRPGIARILGISTAGAIESGMWWNSHGYMRGVISIPSISLEQIFTNDPLQTPDKRAKEILEKHRLASFFEIMKKTLRDCVNEVRVDLGVPKIGEGWINETLLFYRLKELLVDCQVIQHGRPPWLGRQHYDVWIPDLKVAVEYHGEQHFVANAFFGGEAAFRKNLERDNRKRVLSMENGVRLVEVRFDQKMPDEELVRLVRSV